MNKTVNVPFVHGKTVEVTITDQQPQNVFEKDTFGIPQLVGEDLGARATLVYEGAKYGRFKIIENTFDRETGGRTFDKGNISVMQPSTIKKGAWVNKYNTRLMDQMLIAVKIAYMTVYGVPEELFAYMIEDKFGQSCSTCDHMRRPGRGVNDYVCSLGMRPDVDIDEVSKSMSEIIELKGGRFFQAYSCKERHSEDTGPSWLANLSNLDHAIQAVTDGLKADTLGLSALPEIEGYEDYILDSSDPEMETIDPERLRHVFYASGVDDIWHALFFETALAREDRERYPHTINMWEEFVILEEKHEGMDFLGSDPMQAYGMDTACAYGANRNYNKKGFMTHQIGKAIELKEIRALTAMPTIATASSKYASAFKGYTAIDVGQGSLAPSDEVAKLPNPQFIEAYAMELRARFSLIKNDLANIAKNDHILIVEDDDVSIVREELGFTVDEDGRAHLTGNAPIEARHVMAWVMSKVSPGHKIENTNR